MAKLRPGTTGRLRAGGSNTICVSHISRARVDKVTFIVISGYGGTQSKGNHAVICALKQEMRIRWPQLADCQMIFVVLYSLRRLELECRLGAAVLSSIPAETSTYGSTS
jgi:hypothetical protein